MRLVALAAAVVLGGGCTADRPPPRTVESPRATKPICRRMPGPVPEGFVLQRTRELPGVDHVATRREYEAPDGRLLVFLLGVAGEVGEGAAVVEDATMPDGTSATLLGGAANWILTWKDAFPCERMAVVGNGFTRPAFEELLSDMGALAE